MKLTLKIQRAIKFAAKTHQVYQNQKRKGKAIPYITHPLTVGLILSLAGAEEDVIVAGILHDTIEDSAENKKVNPVMIEERFGENVCKLVVSVTEMDQGLSWAERKAIALEHVQHFSQDSVLVKSADVLSNGTELIDDYARYREEVFERFNASRSDVLNNSKKLIKALLSCWPGSPLADDLKNLGKEIENLIKSV